MKKNPWLTLLLLLFVFGSLFLFLVGSSLVGLFGDKKSAVAKLAVSKKPQVLHLELQGVILDGKRFLKPLLKYRKENSIKAIVIEVNSPGGVVGPSQEIYAEILKTAKELKKPVVISSSGLMASGAYYAAVAGDHIMVAPGTMMGSIGVIIEFTNLEKLYDWAKVSRYSITTGKYKDSGAEYRSMRADERELFQNMIDNVYKQFKKAVADGRKMPIEKVATYADGRVFTGEQGVELGFADSTGTLNDAYEKAAQLAGLGSNYEVFDIPKHRPGLLDLLSGGDEDDFDAESSTKENLLSLFGKKEAGAISQLIDEKIFKSQLVNRPLFLMPGSF